MRRSPVAAFVLAVCAVAATAPGQNQCLVLQNGTTGHVDVPHSSTLVPSGGITVEAWVTYNPALGSGWRFPTIARMDPTPSQTSWFLRVEAGASLQNRLLWWVHTTTGDFTLNWFFPAGSLSSWTHLAATFDGATLRLFANGAQVAQGPASGAPVDTNGVLRIGGGDPTLPGGETWNGEIDEVRVWPFARSAAAIASTKDLQLATIPGEVSTWNLDGNALDSSGSNHGAASGTAAFAPSTLPLTAPSIPGLFPVGSGTGCNTNALVGSPALASVGNAGFGFVGTRGPASAVGLLLVGTATLPAAFPIFGIDVHVDLSTGLLVTAVANALGTSDVPFAIPPNPALVGATLCSQFAWFDGACAGGFSATGAMTALVLP